MIRGDVPQAGPANANRPPSAQPLEEDDGEDVIEAGAVSRASMATKASRASREFNKQRAANKGNYQYAIYALYPTGRGFLEMLDEATHTTLAARYGGGRFQVWKTHRDTQEAVGDPNVFEIDRTMYPPRLPGFQGAFPGQPIGGGFNPWGMPPAPGFQGMPSMPQAPGKADDLEEELEDAEDEIKQLRATLSAVTRERDDAKAALEKERTEFARQQERASFEKALSDLKLELGGRKDPLTQLLEMKRAEAELAGPLAGRPAGGPDPLQGAVALFELALKVKDKLTDDPGTGVGSEFLSLIKTFAPALNKAMANMPQQSRLPAPPVPATDAAQAPPPPPTPPSTADPGVAGEEEKAAYEKAKVAFRQLLTFMPVAQETGYTEGAMAAWILKQDGEGWPEAKKIMADDDPEAFLGLVEQDAPALADTDGKKAWILAAIKGVRDVLKEKKT